MRHIKNRNNDDSSCFHFDDLLRFINAQPASSSTRNSNTDIYNELNFHSRRDSSGNKSKTVDFDSLLGSTNGKTSSKSCHNFNSSDDRRRISPSVNYGKEAVQPMSNGGSQRLFQKRKIHETKFHAIVAERSRDTNKKIKMNKYSAQMNSGKNTKSEGTGTKLTKKQLASTIEYEHDYCLKNRKH